MTVQANPLSSAVKGIGKWLGVAESGGSPEDELNESTIYLSPLIHARTDDAAAEIDRYRATLANVSSFLLEHAIEPLPHHYELAYRHRIGGEPGLGEVVGRLVRDGHAMIDAMRSDDTGLSAQLLASLVEQAQQQLADVANIARQSGEEARAYGLALNENMSELAPAIAAHPVLGSLVGLTRMMIEKTNAAERMMRDSAVQMDTMRDNLDLAREQAETDPLTGLNNRRAFERLLGAATERAIVSRKSMSLAFCDIDNFKLVNDTHGHDVGDRVLTFVAKLLAEHVGRRGFVARHGGEEFVLLLEGIDPDDAWEIVDVARHDLFRRNIIDRNGGQSIGSISFSAGVAGLAPNGDISDLLRRADLALYRAKRAGRNQVLLADNDSNGTSVDHALP